MGCRGCRKRKNKFKEEIVKEQKVKEAKEEKVCSHGILKGRHCSDCNKEKHFRSVCAHGVPHDYYCQSCKKVINISEDAVIK